MADGGTGVTDGGTGEGEGIPVAALTTGGGVAVTAMVTGWLMTICFVTSVVAGGMGTCAVGVAVPIRKPRKTKKRPAMRSIPASTLTTITAIIQRPRRAGMILSGSMMMGAR